MPSRELDNHWPQWFQYYIYIWYTFMCTLCRYLDNWNFDVFILMAIPTANCQSWRKLVRPFCISLTHPRHRDKPAMPISDWGLHMNAQLFQVSFSWHEFRPVFGASNQKRHVFSHIFSPTKWVPWKMNGWNLQITHLERKMIWTKAQWLCSMLIFKRVDPILNQTSI